MRPETFCDVHQASIIGQIPPQPTENDVWSSFSKGDIKFVVRNNPSAKIGTDCGLLCMLHLLSVLENVQDMMKVTQYFCMALLLIKQHTNDDSVEWFELQTYLDNDNGVKKFLLARLVGSHHNEVKSNDVLKLILGKYPA